MAHAYQQTIAALLVLNIEPALFLDTLGNQLGTSMMVEGLKFDVLNYNRKNWIDFRHLEIISFHNT